MLSRRPFLLSVSLAVLGGLASPVLAEEAPPANDTQTVGEVVITARRREERLADVPAAASVVDAGVLADRGGAVSTGELLAAQPSVRFNNLTSPLTSELSMRASSTARATNGDPSVGLYRNGAYVGGGAIGGRNFTRLDLFDLGRVEVLRGTQGALYGRNAVGGAVNIVSARPEFENGGYLDVRYGFDNSSAQVQGVANLALSDELALRFGADLIHQEEGFFYNPQNDVYFDQQKGLGLRGQLRFHRGPMDVNLLVESQQLTTPAIAYRLYIVPGTPGFPGGYIQPQYSYPWSTPPRGEQDVDAVMLTIDRDLGWGTLTSTTMYRERDSEYDLDADTTNAVDLAAAKASGAISPFVPIDPGAGGFVADVTRSYSQDIHISGEALSGRLDWLVGVEAISLESRYSVTLTRTPTVANPSEGSYAPAVLGYDSVAGYGSLAYALTPHLNLAGELRYTSDDKTLWARLYDLTSGAPLGGTARMVDAASSPENLSYNLTLSWRLPPNLLAYAKMGTSYRAGGFNANLGDPRQPNPIPAAYEDETSRSLEVGLKGSPFPRHYLALAGYRTELDDMIAQRDNGCAVTNPSCPVAPTSFLTNAGKAESWGVEAELIGRYPVGGGQLRMSLTASRQGGEVTEGAFAGLSLPQVPGWLASADLNYRRPMAGGAEMFGNLLYMTQMGGTQELRANGPVLDNFHLFNLRFGAEFGPVQAALFATNATDQTYIVARDSTIRRYNQPRVIGVQIRYRWQ